MLTEDDMWLNIMYTQLREEVLKSSRKPKRIAETYIPDKPVLSALRRRSCNSEARNSRRESILSNH